jgi:hypothetical protein
LCEGKVVELKSKRGFKYFGCDKKCGFMTWEKPLALTCPSCGKTLFHLGRKKIDICENPLCPEFVPESDRGYRPKKTEEPQEKKAAATKTATSKKKATTKKTTTKKATTKKAPAKAATAKTTTAKSASAKAATAKTTTAKSASARAATTKTTTAKSAPVKKTTTKKAPAKKAVQADLPT